MSDSDETWIARVREHLGRRTPVFDPSELRAFVSRCLASRARFLALVEQHGSPLYVYDPAAVRENARAFRAAFQARIGRTRFYYAVKSNHLPELCLTLIAEGWGLDVSSALELELALRCGATDIAFGGPGKTDADLDAACQHVDRVTLLLDSPTELRRAEAAAARSGVVLHAGLRLSVEDQGLWRKFGVPLATLPEIFASARGCPHIALAGLQFHTSWNLDPGPQVRFLARLGQALSELPATDRDQIEFLNIGGGFWPADGEWLLAESSPEGRMRKLLEPAWHEPLLHHCLPAAPIESFAAAIAEALDRHIAPHVDCEIWTEPGRVINHEGLHLLLTVLDCKSHDLVITDGGTHAVGWERFETDYFPVLNLSRPATVEQPCYVLGSLPTPHDVWGYTYFGSGIGEGDVLLIPNQGTYTYSLRQHFIKPLPKVVTLEEWRPGRPAVAMP